MVKGQERVFEAIACTTLQHFYFPKLIFCVFDFELFTTLYTTIPYIDILLFKWKSKSDWKIEFDLFFPLKVAETWIVHGTLSFFFFLIL